MPYMDATLITLAGGGSVQQRSGQPAHVQDADQIDLDDLAQVLQGLLLDWPFIADPGVVHQHIEASVRGQSGGQRLPVRGVGDVAGHHLDPFAALAGELAEQIGAAGGHQDLRARLMQHPGGPRAQARGGAGHQRDPAIEAPQVAADGMTCRPLRQTHPHPRVNSAG